MPKAQSAFCAQAMHAAEKSIIMDAFGIDDLETRGRDSLDFHDIAIWQIREAIQDAYTKGWEDARANS